MTMTLDIQDIQVDDYEQVVEARDAQSGLHCFIAIHDTSLGPSLGGTRIYPYASRDDALTDVLRLAKGMTYKSAVTELGLGGGKSVILADPKTQKTEELLRAFGRVVDSLSGRYICAEDMGSTLEDMGTIHGVTNYVAALSNEGSSGDPSPYTAWGVFRGMQAVTQKLWGTDSLEGRRIALQGLGAVGAKLLDYLYWHGAQLVISDIDNERAQALAKHYGVDSVDTQEIYEVDCDIFAPCAMGGIINDKTIPNFRCRAIAGAANNQLLRPENGLMLRNAGILYAPDFVINAGGIMNVAVELDAGGYNPLRARDKVRGIYQLLMSVFTISEKRRIPTSAAADELAEHKLRYSIGKRRGGLRLDRQS